MSVKLSLQSLSDWIKDSATATKGAVELTLESGLLKDSLEDLCELGGVAGALFKLGSRAIPDPTPEQRIAARLHKAFLSGLDRELKAQPIEPEVWKKYLKGRLPEVASDKLKGEFTWLSIFGSRGRKPGRSWPIVGELADLGRTWVAEMVTAEERPAQVVQQIADDARGRLHEDLAKEVDKLQTDPAIQQAMTEALSRVGREALDLLAQELTTLKKYRLFGEIPQDAVYLSPTVKVADLRGAQEELDWKTVQVSPNADDLLFQALRNGHPRLLVLEGEMGVGKSCLMRVLASRLAEQYRSDRRLAPVYIRWRDVYGEADLGKAITDQLTAEYGLPFQDLPDQDNLIFLVDGFDEMSSHQEGYVTECFSRLAKLGGRSRSVVVAMRSTVITPGLRLAWKSREALAVQVQEFDDKGVDAWSVRWSEQTGASVTGERLRSLTSSDREVSHNPLLLYMLAKYVEPVAQKKEELTRTEVFRIFVDETIRGKLRTSREEFPFQFPELDYRLLLQEIAWLASWPKHAPKCPARLIRERIPESFLKELNFQDIRTAFVLHFFEPGDLAGNEFEFQPEGFRQYLLAEWCVRAQLDALRDEGRTSHPLARTRAQAIDALAQFPLREVERGLLNEIYEELGRLAQEVENALTSRLTTLGIRAETRLSGLDLLHRLYERVRFEAEEPPAHPWKDEKVGIPEGEEVPPGLDSLRLLFNYWDQCMMATLALFRGLGTDPKETWAFDRDLKAMGRFLRTWSAVRGKSWDHLNMSRFSLANAELKEADLIGAELSGANLSEAKLSAANLSGAILRRAILRGTDLSEANLSEAKLSEADLSGADLSGADLRDANLNQADLRDANLNQADLRDANLKEADLTGASITEEQLKTTRGCPRRLPDGTAPPEEDPE